jgi:hypothetical protein
MSSEKTVICPTHHSHVTSDHPERAIADNAAWEWADRGGERFWLPVLLDYRLNPLPVKLLNRDRIRAARRYRPIRIMPDWRLDRPTGRGRPVAGGVLLFDKFNWIGP